MFDDQFLFALEKWQAGWSSAADKNLKAQALKKEIKRIRLPASFLTCNVSCYRKIDLSRTDLWDLAIKLKLTETISSWSLDFNSSAQTGLGPKKLVQSIVLKHTPVNGEVILNLDQLYKDSSFKTAVANYKGHNFGLTYIGGKEQEVILELSEVSLDEVFGVGIVLDKEAVLAHVHEDEFVRLGITREFISKEFDAQGYLEGKGHWHTGPKAIQMLENAKKNTLNPQP